MCSAYITFPIPMWSIRKELDHPEIDILQLVYEGLTRLDTNQETVPAAAESWAYNDDATQITFTLRSDLTYSDGSPITAENFRYAVERTCDPQTAGEYQYLLFEIVGCEDFAGIGADDDGNTVEFTPEEYDAAKAALGVRVIDDLTLQLDLTNPAPYFHTVGALWVFFPVKQEIASRDPDNWWKRAENHIGNGPFTVTGIAEDQEWTFAANDNYWQGRPLLDGIDYVYVDEAAVALDAYRAGDLDIVQLQSSQIPEVNADPELSQAFVTYPQAANQFLAMNVTMEPFQDKKVREAFAYAIDRETLCTELRSGDCLPTLSFIPEGCPAPSTRISTRSIPRPPGRRWPNRRMAVRTTCRRSSSTSIATMRSGASIPSGLPERSATYWASSSPLNRWRERHSRLCARMRRRIRSLSTSAAGIRTIPTRRTGSASSGPATPVSTPSATAMRSSTS